ISLAQEACARRGWDARTRLAIVKQDRVATFLFKRSPFTAAEIATMRGAADRLQFRLLYAPGMSKLDPPDPEGAVDGTDASDYPDLILAADRERFYESYFHDVRPTTDDRPFFFHTTKLKNQFDVAFGHSMLFGNGLSALLTLIGISGALVAAFVI